MQDQKSFLNNSRTEPSISLQKVVERGNVRGPVSARDDKLVFNIGSNDKVLITI